MMNKVKRRMRTVGMMSLMSVQVTPLSSSKLSSLLTPDKIDPTSCNSLLILDCCLQVYHFWTWASRSKDLELLWFGFLLLLWQFDMSARGMTVLTDPSIKNRQSWSSRSQGNSHQSSDHSTKGLVRKIILSAEKLKYGSIISFCLASQRDKIFLLGH